MPVPHRRLIREATMGKRPLLSKAECNSGPGAELLQLCQQITEQGKLTQNGIKVLIRWLRDNKATKSPAKDYLTATVIRLVADRAITPEESLELYKAIETVLPTEVRKVVAQRRKERANVLKQRARLEKQEEQRRQRKKREQALAAQGIVLLTAKNGRKYQLHSLIGLIEYGHESLQEMSARLGDEIASIVAEHVNARERHFVGQIIHETEGGAWYFRTAQGDFCVPAARIVSGVRPGPLTIAVPPSLVADIERQLSARHNLLDYIS
jgi:hypothetical protein